ncbi:MAG TPA: hypothetical protein VMM13_00315 [Euzebya sp.]|nr:hypothetical protein [Euzebya sp.]
MARGLTDDGARCHHPGQILRLLGQLRDELGIAVLMISHDMGVVAETCDDVVVM